MNALQAKIAAARAANPARFKPGKPAAPLEPPYFNVWNCPVGRAQTPARAQVLHAALAIGASLEPLPF